jgi:hypothetical protein
VERALAVATNEVANKGVPVVHIETYGGNPWVENPDGIPFGADAESARTWEWLGRLLAPLNVRETPWAERRSAVQGVPPANGM